MRSPPPSAPTTPNQAAAQRAADTRDSDGDGVYCESLPCPCSTTSGGSSDEHQDRPAKRRACVKPRRVQPIGFSARSTGTSVAMSAARCAAAGRASSCSTGAAPTRAASACSRASRSATATTATSTRRPSAAGAARASTRGRHPTGWKADVAYVPSSENRSHGSAMGIKLRRFCDGTRFTYVFY